LLDKSDANRRTKEAGGGEDVQIGRIVLAPDASRNCSINAT
jgi:hypothetical protein